VSGLNHQFAKLTNGKLFRGFESPPHRQKGFHFTSSTFKPLFCNGLFVL
jgi:hypothetical protein